MNTKANNSYELKDKALNLNDIIKSAIPMTPLQLNNIKLDVKHTLLTPEYLDNIEKSNP